MWKQEWEYLKNGAILLYQNYYKYLKLLCKMHGQIWFIVKEKVRVKRRKRTISTDKMVQTIKEQRKTDTE